MDIEKLIYLVQKSNSLWDKKNKDYHNRGISRQKWEEIASELNASIETVKTKWRNLRDTFRKEVNKYPKERSGAEGGITQESKWAHFKRMEFLIDQFQNRQLQGNIPRTTQEACDDKGHQVNSQINLDEDKSEIEQQNCFSPENTDNESIISKLFAPPQSGSHLKRVYGMSNDTIVNKLMKFEEEKMKMYKEISSPASHDESSDYYFLMSLLPYLKKVQEGRRMFVRARLQHVLCDEERSFANQHEHEQTSANSQVQASKRLGLVLTTHDMKIIDNSNQTPLL